MQLTLKLLESMDAPYPVLLKLGPDAREKMISLLAKAMERAIESNATAEEINGEFEDD